MHPNLILHLSKTEESEVDRDVTVEVGYRRYRNGVNGKSKHVEFI